MSSTSTPSIPSDWVLCDGNNGTPNLLNSFVIGAGTVNNFTNNTSDYGSKAYDASINFPLGSTGGELTHLLTLDEMTKHNHIMDGEYCTTNECPRPRGGYKLGHGNMVNGSYSEINPIGNANQVQFPVYSTGGDPNNNNIHYEHNNIPPFQILMYIMKIK